MQQPPTEGKKFVILKRIKLEENESLLKMSFQWGQHFSFTKKSAFLRKSRKIELILQKILTFS